MRLRSGIRSIVLTVVGAAILLAQHDTLRYVRSEHMIPMRDSVRLYTVVYAPDVSTTPLPILILRSPYGMSRRADPLHWQLLTGLAQEKYIFVYQDIRGRYRSEGHFEMLHAERDKSKKNSTDESSDTYDSIEWLLKHVANNNGNVGALGVSYLGWTAMMATVDPHPALKAVSEQATMGDMFLGDDFHHNGALRLSYTFEYAFGMEASKGDTDFVHANYDTYDFYLNLGPLKNVDATYFHGTIPTWNAIVAHPNYDAYWQNQALTKRIQHPTVPNLHVAGYWDQEDYYGPLNAYEVLERNDVKKWNHLVLGPWNHGGWQSGDGERLGAIKFDTATGRTLTEVLLPKWFGYYLKGSGDGLFAEAMSFQTGRNQWKAYDAWPPKQSTEVKQLYFHANGKLSFEAPKEKANDAFDSYVSDPAKPVPYRPRPVEATYGTNSRWRTWLVEDQRFVHHRPDVLSWQTETLDRDVTITGDVSAKLFASTTGNDADWVVKLIDVYPDKQERDMKMSGYQLMVASEILRGRFSRSFEKPEALKPNAVNEFTIDLHQINHVFKAGHKIMVQVQSSWFPLYDRNPQTFVPSIYAAQEKDFRKATHSIYRNATYPSHMIVSVEPSTDEAETLANEERAFAAMSREKGITESFVAYLADSCVMFNPTPVNGKELYAKRKENGAWLSWYPTLVELSASGEMGISTGPWEFKVKKSDSASIAFGQFFSVWKKQTDGTWKVAVDAGIDYSTEQRQKETVTLRQYPSVKRTNATQSLSAARKAFVVTAAVGGYRSAVQRSAASDILVYRDGTHPAHGFAKLLSDTAKSTPATLTILGEATARAGDLAFEYGLAIAGKDSSSFLHVWRNTNDWKLVIDVTVPIPK